MRRRLRLRPRLGGDISAGLVATYEYDPWGKLLAVKDADGNAIASSSHAAIKNPLRYRGYYYDTDSGFYYLQSRYYDPQIGRFINADSYVSTGQGLLGCNMFAYCSNNPITKSDSTGDFWLTATICGIAVWKICAVIVAAVVAAVATDIAVKNMSTSSWRHTRWRSKITAEKRSEIEYSISKDELTRKRRLTDTASKYKLGECLQAAKAMEKANKDKGNIIQLSFPNAYQGYVCCDRYPNTAISSNGIHYGYLYEGIVYCNVYPEGKPLNEWIASFYDASGEPPIVTIFP